MSLKRLRRLTYIWTLLRTTPLAMAFPNVLGMALEGLKGCAARTSQMLINNPTSSDVVTILGRLLWPPTPINTSQYPPTVHLIIRLPDQLLERSKSSSEPFPLFSTTRDLALITAKTILETQERLRVRGITELVAAGIFRSRKGTRLSGDKIALRWTLSM